jgi:transcriptional regulator with XRE-family HTH domain
VQRFGDKLRQLRTRAGLTQRSLAQALGYTNAHAYISDFETGKRKPTLEFAMKIAQFFNVSADQLIRDDIELDNSNSSTSIIE